MRAVAGKDAVACLQWTLQNMSNHLAHVGTIISSVIRRCADVMRELLTEYFPAITRWLFEGGLDLLWVDRKAATGGDGSPNASVHLRMVVDFKFRLQTWFSN